MTRLSLASVGLLISWTGVACGDGGSGGAGPSAGTSSGGTAAAGAAGSSGGATVGGAAVGGANGGGANGGSGTAGANGGSASPSAGTSNGGMATAGAAGSGGAASGGGLGTGGSSGCQGALICDDFESYADKPTTPWSVNVDGAGAGRVVIDTAQHKSGSRAVKFTTSGAAAYQQAFISVTAPFPVANNAFYGRMMIYVTKAANNGVHWTMIQGEGSVPTPAIERAVVRYGGQQQQSLMANYDSGPLKSDCWKHSQTKMPEGKWACMEWYFEGATNTQKFWLDGKAIEDLTVVEKGQGCLAHDTDDKWLFPTFKRVYVGWESYQTDDAREVWIDDVAISTTQIGCPQ